VASVHRTIKVGIAGGVGRIALARPDVRNAFDAAMIAELTDALKSASADPSLRVLVLSGEGAAFCAGADAAWMRAAGALSEADGREDALKLAGLFAALDAVPCTTVVVAHGAALGGGAGLVAAADVAIAEEGTKFGFTEVRLGIIPAVISSFAQRAIGTRHARRYFATGEIFDAARAKEIGLVSEVVAPGAGAARAVELSTQLLAVGPLASREAKRLAREIAPRPSPEVSADCAGRIAALRRTPEAQEGLAAFLGKRPPSWMRGDA
jgi:methylglutaconyl-CoA hydratase